MRHGDQCVTGSGVLVMDVRLRIQTVFSSNLSRRASSRERNADAVGILALVTKYNDPARTFLSPINRRDCQALFLEGQKP